MAIAYKVNESGDLVHVLPRDELIYAEVIDYFEELARDRRVQPGCIEVVHFTGVTDFFLSYSQCLSLSSMYEGPKQARLLSGTVFKCKSDLEIGMARMLQTLLNIADPDYEVIVARSEDELGLAIAQLRLRTPLQVDD